MKYVVKHLQIDCDNGKEINNLTLTQFDNKVEAVDYCAFLGTNIAMEMLGHCDMKNINTIQVIFERDTILDISPDPNNAQYIQTEFAVTILNEHGYLLHIFVVKDDGDSYHVSKAAVAL